MLAERDDTSSSAKKLEITSQKNLKSEEKRESTEKNIGWRKTCLRFTLGQLTCEKVIGSVHEALSCSIYSSCQD